MELFLSVFCETKVMARTFLGQNLRQSKKTINFILLRTCRRTTHLFSLRMSMSSIPMIGPGHTCDDCARKFTGIRNLPKSFWLSCWQFEPLPSRKFELIDPALMSTSSERSRIIIPTLHLVHDFILWACWRPFWCRFSVDVLSSLNRLYQCVIDVGPGAELFQWFPLANRPASGKFWCNAVARFLLSSAWNRKYDYDQMIEWKCGHEDVVAYFSSDKDLTHSHKEKKSDSFCGFQPTLPDF